MAFFESFFQISSFFSPFRLAARRFEVAALASGFLPPNLLVSPLGGLTGVSTRSTDWRTRHPATWLDDDRHPEMEV